MPTRVAEQTHNPESTYFPNIVLLKYGHNKLADIA